MQKKKEEAAVPVTVPTDYYEKRCVMGELRGRLEEAGESGLLLVFHTLKEKQDVQIGLLKYYARTGAYRCRTERADQAAGSDRTTIGMRVWLEKAAAA